jgi:hypothetical protein
MNTKSSNGRDDEQPGLQFDESDLPVLSLVIGQVPELRICAYMLKHARAVGLEFPVENAKALRVLMDRKRFKGAGHVFGPKDIERYLAKEFFPIEDEIHLVSRMYLGLVRCKHEAELRTHSQRHEPGVTSQAWMLEGEGA